MRIVGRPPVFAALALTLGVSSVRAQPLEPMKTVVGDPRAALEKDWGPLPVPPGATYEAECSKVRRTAIFFLGLKVDSAALKRAEAHFRREQAKLDADNTAGREVTFERGMAVQALEYGTPESRALLERTVSFLKARGMSAVGDSHPFVPILQFPANTPKAKQLGHTLAASIDGSGIEAIAICPRSGWPTLEFGRR